MTDHRVSWEERDGSNQSAGLYFLIPKAVRGVVKRLLNAPMNSPHDRTVWTSDLQISRSGSRSNSGPNSRCVANAALRETVSNIHAGQCAATMYVRVAGRSSPTVYNPSRATACMPGNDQMVGS